MRSVALSVVLVVLLIIGVGPVVAGSTTAGSSGDLLDTTGVSTIESVNPPTETRQQLRSFTDSHESPETTFTINLQSNRDAEWEISVEYELETETQQEAFRAVAADFEDGTAPDGLNIELYENIAALSSEQTNRDMQIQNVDRSSRLDGTVGTLTLSFSWTEFLAEDGERLVFNDALQTPQEGTWLTSLDDSQELRITTPRGYAITSANVAFTENTVVIEGPHTFDQDEHVRITLEASTFAGTSWELLSAAVVVAAAIIGGALLLRRRDDDSIATTNGGIEANTPTAGTNPVDKAQTEAESAEPTKPTESANSTESAGSTEPTESTEPTKPAEDLSLLADDERVLRLLNENGGRMRQADIVTETNWSDAKVSQLLSSMADDDRITKLRIGRENLISLPDVDAFDGSNDSET